MKQNLQRAEQIIKNLKTARQLIFQGKNRYRCLSRHRGQLDALSPLETAVWRYEGRRGQAADPTGVGERPHQEASS